ncbi:MAG TPA: hypothetical protein VGW75_08645 [Solirubrobacteraceae bacterium]|jgi:hypothetical protein|nr:hypothetical protein [Solirubrobacteraceae bacterium]
MAASERTAEHRLPAALPDRDAARVDAAVVAVPALLLAAGAAASAADPRLGLGAAAVILGWTQLVGI